MELTLIPRAYVCVGLRVSRAPLAIAERLTGNEENERWPPALAFEAFGANVKQFAGSLLNDRDLVRQGELEQARVATLREAIQLETVAAQTKAGAEETFRARRAADEQERQATKERAAKREEEAERKRSDSKKRAGAAARTEKERARRQERKREAELAEAERAAKASELDKERKVLAASKRAAATEAATLETDKKLRATKARRAAS